jgi:hypothetical protein
VKTRLSIIVLALAVALMAASGASAKRMHSHANVRASYHSLVKQAQKSAYKGIDRRAHRGEL